MLGGVNMNRVKELREEMGWTQKYLGSVLNVKNSAISKYENGRATLTEDTIIKLAKLFNVTSDYILGLSDYRNFDQFISEIDRTSSMLYVNEPVTAGVADDTSEEGKINQYYSRLNDENKDYIKGQMITLYREQEHKDILQKSTPGAG